MSDIITKLEKVELPSKSSQAIEADLLGHIHKPSRRLKIWVIILLTVIAFGAFAYYRQLRYGLIVTAMRDYTSWGIYIFNFVQV